MSWTQRIVNFAGGKPFHLFHFLSIIGLSLFFSTALLGTMSVWLVFILSPILAWAVMLVWEGLQYLFDSGFSESDIWTNTKALSVSYPAVGIALFINLVLV